jgi:aerobic-type carbon monoxide dehydrogenase small subunit (CoxS/CutS family)
LNFDSNKSIYIITININNKKHELDIHQDMPLLWVIRDEIGLTGTKYGCGVAICGACTVHIDGQAARSCVTKVKSVIGKKVITIEGLSQNGDHPVQQAWEEINVPQCGYCQSEHDAVKLSNYAFLMNCNTQLCKTAWGKRYCRKSRSVRVFSKNCVSNFLWSVGKGGAFEM